MEKKAIILYSGGLDSSTLVAMAHRQDYKLYTLSFDYGQNHVYELEKAKLFLKSYPIQESKTIPIDLRTFGQSALTSDIAVPKRINKQIPDNEIPITYVPARNTIFLAYTLAWAEVLKAHDIFLGVNYIDYSGYPDCRPEFIQAFSRMANLATKEALNGHLLTIHTPLLHLSKSDIIQTGVDLGTDYSLTHSCYDPSDANLACGSCDSCLLRKKGFQDAGLEDPIAYA